MPVQTIQALLLKPSEMKIVMDGGGKLTFTPLSRRRFRCNQVRRLTRLSQKQIKLIRGQVNGHASNSRRVQPIIVKSAPQPQPDQLRKAFIDFDGDVKCPICGDWIFNVTPGIARRCRDCSTVIVPVKRDTERYSAAYL